MFYMQIGLNLFIWVTRISSARRNSHPALAYVRQKSTYLHADGAEATAASLEEKEKSPIKIFEFGKKTPKEIVEDVYSPALDDFKDSLNATMELPNGERYWKFNDLQKYTTGALTTSTAALLFSFLATARTHFVNAIQTASGHDFYVLTPIRPLSLPIDGF